MKVRATLKLRNESMLKQREKLWLTQAALAEIASVPLDFVSKLEALNFKPCFEFEQKLSRVAGVLELKPEQIAPPEVLGEKFTSRFVSIKDCDPNALVSTANTMSTILELEANDAVIGVLDTMTPREKEVVQLRYGVKGREFSRHDTARRLRLNDAQILSLERRAFSKFGNSHALWAFCDQDERVNNTPPVQTPKDLGLVDWGK